MHRFKLEVFVVKWVIKSSIVEEPSAAAILFQFCRQTVLFTTCARDCGWYTADGYLWDGSGGGMRNGTEHSATCINDAEKNILKEWFGNAWKPFQNQKKVKSNTILNKRNCQTKVILIIEKKNRDHVRTEQLWDWGGNISASILEGHKTLFLTNSL